MTTQTEARRINRHIDEAASAMAALYVMNDNLPPLPEPDTLDRGWELSAYSEEQMQAYARAAIEHQSVPTGWMLVPIEPSDEWIARLESQQTGALEAVDADAIRQCIVELIAAAPQPQPVQPTANSGDAEKAVLDRMAKYVSTITQSEIDEADGDRGITKGTT